MLASITLVLVSIVSGIALLWVFSKTSNQRNIRATKKRLQARLLELRLYGDNPRVVLRAQGALLAENARYFALMLRPAVFATIPMVLLLIVLEGFYGHRALEPGEAAVVTVGLAGESDDVSLQAPDGIAIETAAARAVSQRQVSWRIRPERALAGNLRVSAGGEEATKKIAAGDGLRYLTGRRVSSLLEWFLYPGELPLRTDGIRFIEVRYPSAEVSLFGLKAHWLVWFLIVSMATAFLLKGKFHVTV